MKLKKTSLSAICIAIATMIVAFGCSTLPEKVPGDGTGGNDGDTTAPTLTINSPANDIIINSNNYTVSGTASDAVGLKAIYIKIGNGAFVSLGKTSPWSTNCPLVEGENTISAYAEDDAENVSATNTRVITMKTGAPVISFTSPATSPFLTKVSNITISTVINTTNAVNYVVITNISIATNGGVYSTLTNGGSNYIVCSTNNFALVEGTNTISILADANNGKSSTNSIIVIYDGVAPIVSVNPSNNISTNTSFTATLSVNEDYGYYSTNGSTFVQFTTIGINIDISANTELQYYGEDIFGNKSPTKNIYYYIISGSEEIYVSTSGDDGDDGLSPANAVLSIQKGVELAKSHSYSLVLVEAGVYVQGAGLSNTVAGNNNAGVNIDNADNIYLLGGLNSGFTAKTGYSELDGSGTPKNTYIIYVQNTANITINGFVMRDAVNGVRFNSDVVDSHIQNCVISNHSRGINLIGNSNTINATISGNTTPGNGGGVYVSGSYNTISGIVEGNWAQGGNGGGVCVSGSYNTIDATISGNLGFNFGSGVSISGSYNTISGTVEDNNGGGWYGGGVSISGSYNTITGTVSGNSVIDEGGGVCISGSYNTISGTVSGNSAPYGGGVHIYSGSLSNTISGTISGNAANGVNNAGSAYWTGDWGSGNSPNNWAGNAPLP